MPFLLVWIREFVMQARSIFDNVNNVIIAQVAISG